MINGRFSASTEMCLGAERNKSLAAGKGAENFVLPCSANCSDSFVAEGSLYMRREGGRGLCEGGSKRRSKLLLPQLK